MNQAWQDFLTAQGALIHDGVVQHFGDAAPERSVTRDSTVLCDLSQFGVLRVSGEDAQSFLQNMLSNDIRDVSSSHAQLSSLNNPKGRMQASMLIWRDGADYLLQLPRGLCETIRKKLSMYVLRSKVKISDASDELVCIGLSGRNAETILHAYYPDLPRQSMDMRQCDTDLVLYRDASRFQIVCTAQRAPMLWDELNKAAKSVGSPCWDWLDIQAGIPFVLSATQEAFVPQMVNFEVIGGVNFKKGCYPGQEVVARMHYLGKAKRRMYLAHVEGDIAPQAGDELYSAELEGQSCGMVVNAAAAPQGGFDLLAVVQMASQETQMVHLKSLEGITLKFLPLPYSLPQS